MNHRRLDTDCGGSTSEIVEVFWGSAQIPTSIKDVVQKFDAAFVGLTLCFVQGCSCLLQMLEGGCQSLIVLLLGRAKDEDIIHEAD